MLLQGPASPLAATVALLSSGLMFIGEGPQSPSRCSWARGPGAPRTCAAGGNAHESPGLGFRRRRWLSAVELQLFELSRGARRLALGKATHAVVARRFER